MTKAIRLIFKYTATLGPVGYMPAAPGTFGSMSALLILYLTRPSPAAHLAIAFLSIALGTLASEEAEHLLGAKDSGHIVIDEFAGYMVSMLFLPLTGGYLAASFILFRFFDILKPPPVKYMERIGGGAGVMLDDITAGAMANLILQAWKITAKAL